jgi:hypothetical protein
LIDKDSGVTILPGTAVKSYDFHIYLSDFLDSPNIPFKKLPDFNSVWQFLQVH